MTATAEADRVALRALDLFERLIAYPGRPRFRARLLRREPPEVLAALARLEAAHAGDTTTEALFGAARLRLPPPERVGPFRLVERIGEGGMGEVWRGERSDGLFEQVVAIKLMYADLDEAARAAFDLERRTLARLDHPDIVRLIDGGVTADGIAYLVMDYVEGTPFDAAVAALPLDRRIQLLLIVCEAVQATHNRLVAHGDLKPSNILVDARGRIRLLDFGISAMIGAAAGPAHGAMTRAFASPERLAGAAPSIGDDIYGLGTVLRGIIADADDADLAAIAARATAAQPEARYPSVASLAEELARWRAGKPVAARGGGRLYVTRKFVGRHRVGVAVSLLAVLALVATTIFAVASSIRAERARQEAAARFDDARGTARYLLFTLMDRLEAQPRSLALRAEVARVAQHYLDRLAAAEGALPDVRIEAARGLVRLAEAQAVPGRPNLAQTEEAARNLDRAIALLGDAPQGAAREVAVTALIERARLLSYVDNRADAALATLARAERLLPPNGPQSRLRALLLAERAAALSWKSEHAAAAGIARAALAAMPPDRNVQDQLERARAQDLLAECLYYVEGAAAAVAPYREAVAITEAAAAREPGSRQALLFRSRAQWALGSTLYTLDRNAEALALLEPSARTLRALLAADPDDREVARTLLVTESARGSALADVGQLEAGLAVLRANLAARRAWYERRPDEARRLRDLAVATKALGDTEVRHGRTEAGCRTYVAFRGQIAKLRRTTDFAALDLGYTLADLAKQEQRYCRGAEQAA